MISFDQPAALLLFAATIVTSLAGLFGDPRIVERSLFRPYWFLRRRQYATLALSGFVHADLGHLLFNMVTFYFFAFPMERFLGTPRFLLLYAAGLVLSHGCTWVRHRDEPAYATLGASGAIAAVLFAYVVYFPRSELIILPFPFPIPAVLFAVAYVVYSFYASRQTGGRVNHDAHLCGAITGLAFVLVTDPQAYARLFTVVAG